MQKKVKFVLYVFVFLVCARFYYNNMMSLEEKVLFWGKVSDFTGKEYVYINGSVKTLPSDYYEKISDFPYEYDENETESFNQNSPSPFESGKFGWEQAYSDYVANKQAQSGEYDTYQEPDQGNYEKSYQEQSSGKENRPIQNPQTVPATQAQDRLASVPAECRENALLRSRMSGSCESLTGNVLMTVIFVNDPSSSWSEIDMQSIITGHTGVTNVVMEEASAYGANLNLMVEYRNASVSYPLGENRDPWVSDALKSAGLWDMESTGKNIEVSRNVKEAPVLFYLNTSGRAFAMPSSSGKTECAILYAKEKGMIGYRHELYHLFGAADLYYPDRLMEIAGRYFPNSIMYPADYQYTDEFTAYLIGWTDQLTSKSLDFLRETSFMTEEYLAEANRTQLATGYVTGFKLPHGIYTGYVEQGIPNGEGQLKLNDGSVYTGFFASGNHDGYGVFQYANGAYYDGYWKGGKMDGQGLLVYADGAFYEGSWVNNQKHGYGKFVYANGVFYEGSFQNDSISGCGTMRWPDGAVYTGDFYNGKFHGNGSLHYPNGNVLSGYWEYGNHVG